MLIFYCIHVVLLILYTLCTILYVAKTLCAYILILQSPMHVCACRSIREDLHEAD